MLAKIYIAGPYSNGNRDENVHNAYEVANQLADLNFAPFVPHATHYWDLKFPRSYEYWIELDLVFLKCCDALFRMPGYSPGADREVEFAKKNGLPVFEDINNLHKHFIG
jgi:hypothetical protein